MNYTVTSTGNDFMKEDLSIKKGDRFYCYKDVRMLIDNDIAYQKGKIYLSEKDGCITDDQGLIEHAWEDRWTAYFTPLPHPVEKCNCEKCEKVKTHYCHVEGTPKVDSTLTTTSSASKDYFQSVGEEYRRTFESGAVRDSNEGKSRPDLISPYFTERLGFRLAEGAKKYEENNWKKGIPTEAFLESLERHLVAYKMGKTDEDHAAAIAFNIMGIIHNEEVRKLTDL